METKSKDVKDQMYAWVMSEICQAQEAGVPVMVDGRVYSVQDGEKLQNVMENGYYMKSYVGDSAGKIVRIDFDHIKGV